MKYYLIAGEASGDLHASRLMQSLKETDNQAEFRFFGGDLMSAVGGTRVKHYREHPRSTSSANDSPEHEDVQGGHHRMAA